MLLVGLIGLMTCTAYAAEVAGQWRGEFDSQIGHQTYLFTFQMSEARLTAKATAEVDGQKREVEFKEPKLDGSTLSFFEMRTIQDNEIRLTHLDTFAWVGGFSSAPNTKPPAELAPDPAAVTRQLKLLFLFCGNKDGLIRTSQGVHAYLKEKGVPHVWHVDGNAHDATHWRNGLHHFAQKLFR
jgi:hypothetical protein